MESKTNDQIMWVIWIQKRLLLHLFVTHKVVQHCYLLGITNAN